MLTNVYGSKNFVLSGTVTPQQSCPKQRDIHPISSKCEKEPTVGMKADSCSVAIALSATERELVVVDEIGGAGIGVIRVFCRNRNLTTGVLEVSMLLDDADDALEVDVDEEAAAETLLVAPCSCERKSTASSG